MADRVIETVPTLVDRYHPHYPDVTKDHFARLMRFAGLLLTAERLGIKHVYTCNREQRELLESARYIEAE